MSAFQPPGETFRLAGKVKWFNRSKGFGFVVPNDGSGDVFLPLSVLERAGHSELPDGASIVFDWTQRYRVPIKLPYGRLEAFYFIQNLFNTDWEQATFAFESRLRTEPAGVTDIRHNIRN